MKIAMWSGPRNLSTAMMYAFGNRSDFAAWDEPFYASYLKRTCIDHPMRDEIVATHDADPVSVGAKCAGPVPDDKPHWYMKHMGIHMDDTPLEWAKECVNVHLIRHPARVIASYTAKRENPTLHDIGFAQQVEIFDRFPGPVIDSADIRENPERMLRRLCEAIDLDFDPAMLIWAAGPRTFDGVWAKHWYGAVHQSTGFAGTEGALPILEGQAAELCDAALPFYRKLAALKL
ncbi:HAD family hydrolase [uncultured Pelagimonas sp.]|uniref:sulfotransferase-like domain-containing protein n=1 Tax=uncultured Pelagimonas sp. TaxID=1618102 RepID=UPI00262C02D8|nr:HAD family hydrolase [uncultured Pelagimonas sp.]